MKNNNTLEWAKLEWSERNGDKNQFVYSFILRVKIDLALEKRIVEELILFRPDTSFTVI